LEFGSSLFNTNLYSLTNLGYAMTKEDIFRKLYESELNRVAYIDSIPIDIRSGVFDNLYVNEYDRDHVMMLNHIFGDATDSITWFLYEWAPGWEVGYHGIERKINTIDEYIDWLKNIEGVDLS